jgi:predicted alpha/beta superfamily hydrolase
VWTAVPDKAPPAAGYPVLYMLDGNAVMDKLNDAFCSSFPPAPRR